MSILNYYKVHKNKKPKLNIKSKLYYKCFYKNLEKQYPMIKKRIQIIRKEAIELAKNHKDVKPIKYLLK